jgi:hypothetical protein
MPGRIHRINASLDLHNNNKNFPQIFDEDVKKALPGDSGRADIFRKSRFIIQ